MYMYIYSKCTCSDGPGFWYDVIRDDVDLFNGLLVLFLGLGQRCIRYPQHSDLVRDTVLSSPRRKIQYSSETEGGVHKWRWQQLEAQRTSKGAECSTNLAPGPDELTFDLKLAFTKGTYSRKVRLRLKVNSSKCYGPGVRSNTLNF